MSISILLGAGLFVCLVALMLWRLASQAKQLEAALNSMRQGGSPSPVLAVVSQAPDDKRPDLLNQAISGLWQSYDRRKAALLVKEAVQVSNATVLQYWMNQVLEVEPDIAEDVFDQAFIDQHYNPEVAERCGPSGCCG